MKPRDFNKIEMSNIDTIIKSGEDLSGEIYYYKNIPNEIKYLFPILFLYKDNQYEIEKIHGLTMSELYVFELLQPNILIKLLDNIVKIHNLKISSYEHAKIPIYDNYVKKLKSRYNNYDYSKFKNNDVVYKELLKRLTIYEQLNCGNLSVVHGDPVFTNIIVNKYDDIKFIDMRGKIGNILSICGDSLYDYAKIYQSLIGYDCILLSKNISLSYKNKMIECFKKYFIKQYSETQFNNLKLITKSLLFTLIPLHDNDKCQEYYELIFSSYLN